MMWPSGREIYSSSLNPNDFARHRDEFRAGLARGIEKLLSRIAGAKVGSSSGFRNADSW